MLLEGIFAVTKYTSEPTRKNITGLHLYFSSSSGATTSSLNVLALSTYKFHLSQSWVQLVQFFIFIFFMSFVMLYSHLFFGLPSGRVNIGFQLYIIFFTIIRLYAPSFQQLHFFQEVTYFLFAEFRYNWIWGAVYWKGISNFLYAPLCIRYWWRCSNLCIF